MALSTIKDVINPQIKTMPRFSQDSQLVMPQKPHIPGVNNGVISTIFRPTITPLFDVVRLPYGSSPTSIYSRRLTMTITNRINNINYTKLAYIWTPLGTLHSVIPLDDGYIV